MKFVTAVTSVVLILIMLVDAFEATVLPRQVIRRWRLARIYYRTSWRIWRTGAAAIPSPKRRESMLGWFGPLSLFGLFATWSVGLIIAFAMLHWSIGTTLHGAMPDGGNGPAPFGSYCYFSGVTFFTLGYGDLTPVSAAGRFLAVLETGLGFGFLALVIAYMPVLYQAFSRRETTISLLDARAGSPPSASEMLLRLARTGHLSALDSQLAEWERWAGELLESQLSFPLLGYYRSQHNNQSWLAAVTTMLDTCSLLLSGPKQFDTYRAKLTFAMARHAVVDLSLVLRTPVDATGPTRLAPEQLNWLRVELESAGLPMHDLPIMEASLTQLRALYEPFTTALAKYFEFALPAIVEDQPAADNWQRSAWLPRAPGFSNLPAADVGEQHF